MTSTSKLILVTGDVLCDHNYYQGDRPTADSRNPLGFRYFLTGGGALLLKKLVETTTSNLPGWKTEFGLNEQYEELPPAWHAFCLWQPQTGGPAGRGAGEPGQVWRAVEPPLGYGNPAPRLRKENAGPFRAEAILSRATPLAVRPEVLVVDDAGLGFRESAHKEHWPFAKRKSNKEAPRWVILKLTGTLDPGEFWRDLSTHCRRNLVLVVSADKLRRSDVRLSRGLSWEATSEDLVSELERNSRLKPLLAARHLIISFGADGAFWLDNGDRSKSAMLVFDAERAEGEWAEGRGSGTVFGLLSCFTAAIAYELCRSGATPDLESALIAGLGAGRELWRQGHGRVAILEQQADGSEQLVYSPAPGFPFAEIAAKIRQPTEKFVSAPISLRPANRGAWMLLDEWQVHARNRARQQPFNEAAYAVAVMGPGVLERFPVARFGDLRTVDRKEIENLRTIRQLISAYERGGPQKRPLSLGVFGPPGAGKSFGVIQIANAVLGLAKADILTFNLAQFNEPAELHGALHRVRDRVLSGRTPLVFWDEFDSQGYRWLQYLLAPMEDGTFQEGQITHPIGKCVFVFAGATSAAYEAFGPRKPETLPASEINSLKPEDFREVARRWLDFVLKKGPDFKTRLAGYLNVLGPNPRQRSVDVKGDRRWVADESDFCYPIRRALFIRYQMKLKPADRLDMDSGVLRALLEIPEYKFGARSLEFLCGYLREWAKGQAPRRSLLPGAQLLDLHVDQADFWRICERDLEFLPYGTVLAPALHEAYRLRIQGYPEKRWLNVPFEQLSEDRRAANLGQASRIPGILRIAGMRLVKGRVVPLARLAASRTRAEAGLRKRLANPDLLELLSEAEHNGWMVERMLRGWRYHRQRQDDKLLHENLLPYNQLPEDIKTFDRQTIIGAPAPAGKPHLEQYGYIDLVKIAGFRVVMAPPGARIKRAKMSVK